MVYDSFYAYKVLNKILNMEADNRQNNFSLLSPARAAR